IHQRGFSVLGGEGKCILLVAPAPEQHTLGALVLADQLRRLGFSVKMCLGQPAEDVIKSVFENKFDAILFSASSLEAVEISAQCVNLIRQNYAYQPVVFLGGCILSSPNRVDVPNVFDHVTNKLDVIVNSFESAHDAVSEDNRI
ncbi:MAG: cobalamin B12-binding domain-containing protein, partial [Paracoccaceae bacterium]